jgi:N-acetylneuraminic acid mutarotase
MQKKYAYVIGCMMMATTAVLTASCEGSGEDDEDLVGNWKASDYFDGNSRTEAATFTIGDKVYLTTGNTDRDRFKDLWVYSTTLHYWEQKADFGGTARNSAVAFAANGKGYVGTGYDGTSRMKDFWEYDPATDQWSQKADFMSTAREEAIAFSIGGKGYVGTGYDGNYLKDLYEFTPGASAADPGAWKQMASMGGGKRKESMVFVLNNKAYVISGNNNGTAQTDLWMFDPTVGLTGEWTEKRKIFDDTDEDFDDDYAIARYSAVAFTIGNYGYVSCGQNGSSYVTTTWEYDPSTDVWKEKTGFEGSARIGAVAFTLNSRAFVLTGNSGSLWFDNMYEWEPNAEQNDDDN